MSAKFNHLVLDNPNIPVYSSQFTQQVKFGELMDVSGEVCSYFDPETISKDNQLRIQDMYLPHFSIRSFAGEFKHEAVLVNKKSQFTDEVINCFFYGGSLKAFFGNSYEVSMGGGTQLLRYDPQNEIKCWCEGNQPFHIIRLFTSPDYFLDLLSDEPWTEYIRAKILRKEKILQTGYSMISQAQQSILHNILNCPLTGKSAQLMIETSAIQLILLQIHAMALPSDKTCNRKINKRDAELMWSIRDFLSKTFTEEHTMQSLTKTFGTNKFKLNTLFKDLFGITPFEFIRDQKMNTAKLHLSEGLSVGEVAQKLGYKNPHHFAAAFKKAFNTTPSDFKTARGIRTN